MPKIITSNDFYIVALLTTNTITNQAILTNMPLLHIHTQTLKHTQKHITIVSHNFLRTKKENQPKQHIYTKYNIRNP